MQFRVKDELFTRFPTYCVGLVVVEGMPNALADVAATQVLRDAEQTLTAADPAGAARRDESFTMWRSAFKEVGINPSRFKTSIDALLTRALKGEALPSLSPAVDLANAMSLRFQVPIGAHDLGQISGDVTVGPLTEALPFRPFNAKSEEIVAPGEFVYADARTVCTRRWVWRQSDQTKVTASTERIIFPIDGWIGVNEQDVQEASRTLADLLHTLFGLSPKIFFIEQKQSSVTIEVENHLADTVVSMEGGFRMAGTAYLEQRAVPATLPESATAAAGVEHSSISSEQPQILDEIGAVLKRRTVEVVVRDVLEQRLRRGEKLRIKFGVDPTGPQLHLGHAVQLRKLREFQRLGHTICLVVGDFTAQIGDASDKTAMRQMISEEQIYENLASYRKQIARVLDADAVEWSYNNDWLGPMRFRDIVGLASHFTVAQMLERENFSQRFASSRPIGLQEFMYPLMQGYDSVALKADVEIGGTEQLFNLMAGRTLQQAFGQRPQAVITCSLLLGTDGLKMSKTAGNCIYIEDSARDMYGKVMSITDAQLLPYFELCTEVPLVELTAIQNELAAGINPMQVKKRLAFEITRLYHTQSQAQKAQESFEQEVQRKELPKDIPEVLLPADQPISLPDLLVKLGLVSSKSDARRVSAQNGVRIDGNVHSDPTLEIQLLDGMMVQVGKRKYARVRLQT